ncbi:hypothetical protein [Streptomyces sp. NPDC050564]|uniref:hypothetical protein n=1 Tax=Streptomyces sp. NPDC050564 TaxID=3365631 RepID=UPI0037BE0573
MPKPRPKAVVRAAPQPNPSDEVDSTYQDDDVVVRKFLSNRRKRRQLRALKIASYVLIGCFLAALGLTIWQLTIPSMFAGVYAGLTGVFATCIGVSVTVYHYRRKSDRDDPRT